MFCYCRLFGIYTTMIYATFIVVRGLLTDLRKELIFTEMPFVDRLLQLKLDIATVNRNYKNL